MLSSNELHVSDAALGRGSICFFHVIFSVSSIVFSLLVTRNLRWNQLFISWFKVNFEYVLGRLLIVSGQLPCCYA
jgi:hypothetical protein